MAKSLEVLHVCENYVCCCKQSANCWIDSSRLTRTESSVRLRTREEFKELLKESNSDLKQAVLPTSPKKNRRRVSIAYGNIISAEANMLRS